MLIDKLGIMGLVLAITAQLAAIVVIAVYAPLVVSVPLIVALIIF